MDDPIKRRAQLERMDLDYANKHLSLAEKIEWAEIRNRTANLYCIRHGEINEVPPQGWWY